jgi:hypothetical protein
LLAIKPDIPFNGYEFSKFSDRVDFLIFCTDNLDSVGNPLVWSSWYFNHGFNLQVGAKHKVQQN